MDNTPEKNKVFTLAQANAALPLIRVIIRDITQLAEDLRDRHQRWRQLNQAGSLDHAHQEEVRQIAVELENGQEKLNDLVEELQSLHVEMKDPFLGLVDFPCLMDGRIVYLCWKKGEPEVAHWHELWAGYAGRQPLTPQCQKMLQAAK